MANKNEFQVVQKNSEAVELFAKLEKISKENPDIFQFFLSKYGSQMLDYYDWGRALWNTDEKPAGILDKFIPYITTVLTLIVLIVLIMKK